MPDNENIKASVVNVALERCSDQRKPVATDLIALPV